MAAYYNEIEPYAAEWLRNLMRKGLIADGEIDTRSIVDLRPDDLREFTQCHFFAGIAGWSLGARLAGWPDDRPLWTGSCPCQPFSAAGKQKGTEDERHLWPEFFRLIEACRPPVVMGEQVAAAVGKDWLDGVFADLEGIGYTCGAAVVPACAVDAPHRRDRLWFVASGGSVGHCIGKGLEGHAGHGHNRNRPGRFHADEARPTSEAGRGSPWADADWIGGHDGKARRVKPGVRLLAHGVPARVGRLRALGNAIVPQVAAEVIGAYMSAIKDTELTATGWVRVMFAADCDEDGNCPVCDVDFSECSCPGPTQEEEYEYTEDSDGVLWARPLSYGNANVLKGDA